MTSHLPGKIVHRFSDEYSNSLPGMHRERILRLCAIGHKSARLRFSSLYLVIRVIDWQKVESNRAAHTHRGESIMRRFASKVRSWLNSNSLKTIQRSRRPLSRRLDLEILEDRSVPSGMTPGVISGLAFVDSAATGIFNSGEITLPGMNVTLMGTTGIGTSVSITTPTDAGGAFSFSNVPPGTYQLSAPAGSGILAGGPSFGNTQGPEGTDLISGIAVALGQTVHQNLGFSGLAPSLISMRLFLSSTTAADIPLAAGGNGSGTANYHTPTVRTPIADVSLGKNSPQTSMDLATHFTDP